MGSADQRFVDLDTLKSASGLKAVISQRTANGLITFSIVKEFERDGGIDWTSFCPETHLKDYRQMLDLVEKRILELRQDPKTMPLKKAANGARR